MNQSQIERIQQISSTDEYFYLTCKSAAAGLEIPYPGQFADRLQAAIESGRWGRDEERVALEILRQDAQKNYLDNAASEWVALFDKADEISARS